MKLKAKFLGIIKPIIFFFVKYECTICNVELENRNAICFDCNRKMGVIDQSSICEKCGRFCLADSCIFCIQKPPSFNFGRTVCIYNAESSAVIKAFKYYGNSLCGEFMAQKMTHILQKQFPIEQIDIITAVPMSWLKEYFKGRNHASQLAMKIAKNIGIEYNSNILKRKFKFKRQALLNQQQRRDNVRGVFTARKNISGKTVLIIDDTITTGSTLNECTKALLNAGAKGVFVLTFAKSIADEQILHNSL